MKDEKDNILSEVTSGEYKYGFHSDIETDTIPKGLSEDVVRIISAKKNELALAYCSFNFLQLLYYSQLPDFNKSTREKVISRFEQLFIRIRFVQKIFKIKSASHDLRTTN